MAQSFANCGVDTILALGAPRTKQASTIDMLATFLGERPSFEIITYNKFKVAGRLEILGNYFGVRSLLKQHKADVCFVDDVLISSLCLDAGFSTIFKSHQSNMHNTSCWISDFWKKELLQNVKKDKLIKLVTISKALADIWIARGVPENKIIICHDGINHNAFAIPKSQGDTRKILQLPENKKIAVYAGNLQPDRGIERIIELAKRFSEVLFVVVGGPENRRKYFLDLSSQALVNNIIWVGYVPHTYVPDYLYAADILLMLWTWGVPTIKVCSPLKMFEYMAAGRIIVGEAFPTITEVLENGKTAYLADPNSFEDLCNKLNQALTRSYPSAMACRARQLALTEYSWNNRAWKIVESAQALT